MTHGLTKKMWFILVSKNSSSEFERKRSLIYFVNEFPNSKPTIIEMRKLITHSTDFKTIVIAWLSIFEKKVLNPSGSTTDALLAYVKSVKAFLTLDPSGRSSSISHTLL